MLNSQKLNVHHFKLLENRESLSRELRYWHHNLYISTTSSLVVAVHLYT